MKSCRLLALRSIWLAAAGSVHITVWYQSGMGVVLALTLISKSPWFGAAPDKELLDMTCDLQDE